MEGPVDQCTQDAAIPNISCSELFGSEGASEANAQSIETSPRLIDRTIQQQGKELHELLQLFKQANTDAIVITPVELPVPNQSSVNVVACTAYRQSCSAVDRVKWDGSEAFVVNCNKLGWGGAFSSPSLQTEGWPE
jgi:hypothetical protein